MAQGTNIGQSGDGTRPTTDGGTDNIGAGEKFDSGSSAAGENNSGPAPHERMQNKRSDAEAAEHDDSVPLGLHGEQHSETNKETPPTPSR